MDVGFFFFFFVKILSCLCYPSVCLSIRNVAKMEDAKVEIDDGKDESVVPDTTYQ